MASWRAVQRALYPHAGVLERYFQGIKQVILRSVCKTHEGLLKNIVTMAQKRVPGALDARNNVS
jgi:hypothetical protein